MKKSEEDLGAVDKAAIFVLMSFGFFVLCITAVILTAFFW